MRRLTAMSGRRWFVACCLIFAMVVASGLASPGVGDEWLQVSVFVVRASRGAVFIDPELGHFREGLAFTDYDGFALVQTAEAELIDGGREDFPLGTRRLRVDLLEHDGATARVRLRLYGQNGGKVLDSGVKLGRGRTFFVAGPKVGDDVLILPVTATW